MIIHSFKKFFYSGNAFSKFYDSGISFIELTLATKSKWVDCNFFSSLKILPEYITNNRTCLIKNGKFTIDTLLSKSFHRFQIDFRETGLIITRNGVISWIYFLNGYWALFSAERNCCWIVFHVQKNYFEKLFTFRESYLLESKIFFCLL